MPETELVLLGGGVSIEVLVTGTAPEVVLLPSANRSASDFARLSSDLAAAGLDSLAVNPRGVAGSTGPTDELSMRDLADDVAGVIDRLVGRPMHVVGHALGNTIARATATFRPSTVRSVALLACGGHDLGRRQPPPEVMVAFARCHRADLSTPERLAALGTAFFAEGNDPAPWLEGWYPGGQAVAEALGRSEWREWYLAGSAPVLIVQPTEDQLAPIEVGQELAAALGDRVDYVEVAHCGHAILPEQPTMVAEQVVAFLRQQGLTTGTRS
jgi:pimeloyl-ACP methyl ester carboxylesterase